jgi:hypothetical protein
MEQKATSRFPTYSDTQETVQWESDQRLEMIGDFP